MSTKADGKPGAPRNAVQFNDVNSFGGDAGLTYDKTIQQLTVSASDDDKTTPLFKAYAGDFHATTVIVSGGPDSDMLFTATDAGAVSNDITIAFINLGFDQVLTVVVVGLAITVNIATDNTATPTSTANDVIAAISGDVGASALVVATNAPGSDGSGLVGGGAVGQLSGGADAAATTWIDERGVVNIQLQTGLGLNALSIRDPAGDVVAHIDNDGGFGFASDYFTVSQNGNLSVDTQEAGLVGNTTLRYAVNGFALFTIAAGGGYGFSVNSPVATDILFNVAAGTGQTGDLFVAFDENFVKTVRILPNGDLQFDQDALGPILIDRTTADRYRLYVDNGVLGIEAV